MAFANVVPFEDGFGLAGMALTAGFASDADLQRSAQVTGEAGEWTDTVTRYAAVDDLDEEDEDEDDEDDDLDDDDLEDEEDEEDLDDEDLEDEDADYDDDDEEEDEEEDEDEE